MSTKTKKKPQKRQRPEKSLDAYLIEEGVGKGKKKSLIDKQFTAIKAPGSDGEYGGTFTPDDDQLERINQFTATPKSADEVLCFSTLSCNDMIDRDLDRFTTECVKDFASLEGALSPVGKSFMVSHDYSKLPVGRIFGVDTTKIEGTTFLTNEVYMPNTDQYKDFAENIDFGIYWAVSVGVMLEDSACSVCSSPMVGNYWTFCIENGHEKGLYYDPDSEEKDGWGWAEPVEEGSKNAVLCTRDLFSPKDFYELSQCFLGAQYDAALERGAMKGIAKAASASAAKGGVPFINLAKKEAAALPFTHAPDEVREAYSKGYSVETDEEGALTWVDDNDLVWAFEPGEDEVLCLGEKTADNDNQEVNDDGTEDGSEPEVPDDGGAPGADGSVGVEDQDGLADEDELLGDDAEPDADAKAVGAKGVKASSEDDEEEDEEEDDSDEDDSDDNSESDADDAKMPKAKMVVLNAARKARLSDETVKLIRDADGNGLDALMTEVGKQFKRASLGEQFVKAKQAEAIKWYVRARQSGKEEGINTKRFQRMLDVIGDDIDMIDEVIEEHKEMAQAKFPASVRRSTVERDPETIEELEEVPMSKDAAEKVRRVHG